MSEVEDYLRKHKIFGRLKPYNPIDERDCDSHSFLSYQDALEAVRIAREEHKREMEEEIIKGRKKMLEHIKNFVEINIKARDEELTRLCEKSTPFVPLGESSMGVSVPSKGTSKGGELKDGF